MMSRFIEKAALTAATLTLATSVPAQAQTGGSTYDPNSKPRDNGAEKAYGPCPSPQRLKKLSPACGEYVMKSLRRSVYDNQSDQLAVATYQQLTHGKLAVDGALGPLTAKSVLSGYKMKLRNPAAANHRDHLIVDKSDQVMYVVKNSRLKHVLKIASGTEEEYSERDKYGNKVSGTADTPVETRRIYEEADGNFSGPLGDMPFALKYNSDQGIFVHAGVVSVQGRLSHGCIRVPREDMTDLVRPKIDVGDYVTVQN